MQFSRQISSKLSKNEEKKKNIQYGWDSIDSKVCRMEAVNAIAFVWIASTYYFFNGECLVSPSMDACKSIDMIVRVLYHDADMGWRRLGPPSLWEQGSDGVFITMISDINISDERKIDRVNYRSYHHNSHKNGGPRPVPQLGPVRCQVEQFHEALSTLAQWFNQGGRFEGQEISFAPKLWK